MLPNLARKLPGSVDSRIVDCMSSLVRRRYCTCESHHQVKLFTALPAHHKFSPVSGPLRHWRQAILSCLPGVFPHQRPIPTIHRDEIQIGRSPAPKMAGLRLSCLGDMSRVMRGGQVAGPCPMIGSRPRTPITRPELAAARNYQERPGGGGELAEARRVSADLFS